MKIFNLIKIKQKISLNVVQVSLILHKIQGKEKWREKYPLKFDKKLKLFKFN